MKEALSPVESATVEASKGAAPVASTKIVVVLGAPTHSLTTRTDESCWVFVIVHVMVDPPTAGEVTGNGAPVYGCTVPSPHRIVAA